MVRGYREYLKFECCYRSKILAAYDEVDPLNTPVMSFRSHRPRRGDCPGRLRSGESGGRPVQPFGTDTPLGESAAERVGDVFVLLGSPAEANARVRTVHEVGRPAWTAVGFAVRHDVDNVVTTGPGYEVVPRFSLGSASEGVVRRSPVPAIVVR
jgi:nucleotide-binding universal stress UspA family protein